MKEFIINKSHHILLDGLKIDADTVAEAAVMTNRYFRNHIKSNEDIQFYNAIMEGNGLSAGIGALFNSYMSDLSRGNLMINPYKCGKPDLINVSYADSDKKIQQYKDHLKEFKSYPFGGIETKSTMIRQCKNLGWGIQRIKYSKSFSWKAHHNENENLCGIVWDFVDEIPQIVAIMYCDKLYKEDWGKFHSVEKKTIGGYSLSKGGTQKMRDGWICVLNNKDYINGFNFETEIEGEVSLW